MSDKEDMEEAVNRQRKADEVDVYAEYEQRDKISDDMPDHTKDNFRFTAEHVVNLNPDTRRNFKPFICLCATCTAKAKAREEERLYVETYDDEDAGLLGPFVSFLGFVFVVGLVLGFFSSDIVHWIERVFYARTGQ